MSNKSIFLSTVLFVLAFTLNAQNDIMYIMKDGLIVDKYNVHTEVDSVIFYKPYTFTDIRDNTVYSWVEIGNQIWMSENLKYLPSVVGPNVGSETESHYYVYEYDGTDVNAAKATEHYSTYGVLYNWTAALNACPNGWHLPSDDEWTELTDYLGSETVAGGKLKETGTTHWISPNTSATNESGFTALPGGERKNDGTFDRLGNNGFWWTVDDYNSTSKWSRIIYNRSGEVGRFYDNNKLGLSVRCVKD